MAMQKKLNIIFKFITLYTNVVNIEVIFDPLYLTIFYVYKAIEKLLVEKGAKRN
jgi:hypothetical protein